MSGSSGWFLVLGLLALTFSGCYEPQEGCLDLDAVNYDFSADNNAPDDCQYPELRIQFRHRYSTADTIYTFRLNDSVYLDESGNPFTVERFQFFISETVLETQSGAPLTVEDELEIFLENPGGNLVLETVADNFALASAGNSSTISLGTLRASGNLSAVSFFVGVNGQANFAIADSIPPAHPLGLTDSLLYFNRDSGYVFQLIQLYRDTTVADTIPETLRIGTFANLQQVEFPVMDEKVPGFHLKLVVDIDYRKWLSGINVQEDSPEELQATIVGNTAEAFSLSEIVLE